MALPAIDWDGTRINAEVTKSQVEQSPDIVIRTSQFCGDFFLDSPIVVNGGQTEADDPNLRCAGLSRAR